MTVERSKTLNKNNDPMHGVTLLMIVTQLQKVYGWEELGRKININCFKSDPSIKSSLTFLRKTPWARDKVEQLYLTAVQYKKIKVS
ncbi:hypothetical protein MNBD_UNCLBAC01-1977 [hydrothermal vent metagenome]|uniref:Transporter n=1 Tax=hydrothermal vent metagenome TaxID=652676 RepID=A0A3B1DLC1_9ZZZZ